MNLPGLILLEQTGKSLMLILQVTSYVIENLNIENVTFCEDHWYNVACQNA